MTSAPSSNILKSLFIEYETYSVICHLQSLFSNTVAGLGIKFRIALQNCASQGLLFSKQVTMQVCIIFKVNTNLVPERFNFHGSFTNLMLKVSPDQSMVLCLHYVYKVLYV